MKNHMEKLIIVRGGGDIATGTIHRLYKAGFPLLILEAEKPSAIRRQVAFSEAVYGGWAQVEDLKAMLIGRMEDGKFLSVNGASLTETVEKCLAEGSIPLLVDPVGEAIELLKPQVVVDAILAKRNLGTNRAMAPLTIGLGPGFVAGQDVDYVVETMRGHNLGRIIEKGSALADTGIPGIIGGYGAERVIHSPAAGLMENCAAIGDSVRAGDTIAYIEKEDGSRVPVEATIDGFLRGLIRSGYGVTEGFKIADIDPRLDQHKNCFTISDKARSIGGSVLELVCGFYRNA